VLVPVAVGGNSIFTMGLWMSKELVISMFAGMLVGRLHVAGSQKQAKSIGLGQKREGHSCTSCIIVVGVR